MPIYRAVRTAPQEFDGLAPESGLFDINQTGNRAIQVLIRSYTYHTNGSGAWSLEMQDPATALPGAPVLIRASTATSLVAGGPEGFIVLPTNADGASWVLRFTTTGLVGTGEFTIDYDFLPTDS